MGAVGEMTRQCYRSWYLALAELPYWDEETDRAALRFVEACRNVSLGNLYWRLVPVATYLPTYLLNVHSTLV